MSVINLSSSRILPDNELERVVQLAVILSGRLNRAPFPEIGLAIADALEEVASATRADGCRLIEFNESGSIARTHLPRPKAAEEPSDPAALDREILERLGRGELVTITRADQRPYSVLGIPASVGGQVVCALVLDCVQLQRRWPQALVERLQLLTDMMGAALQRARHESALQANGTMIERLNTRLEADNLYLKEEIKSYHDFDDIVGESATLRLALTRLAQVAPTNSSVLLLGPTGTGKELFARARPRAQPAPCAAAGPGQLRGAAADAGRERAVRPRERRLHRRGRHAAGTLRAGRRRHDLPRRNRRPVARRAGQVPARAAGRGIRARRILADQAGRRPRDRRHAPRPRGRSRRGNVPGGSVLPAERLSRCGCPSLRERAEDIPRLVWFFINRHQRDLGRHITNIPQSVMDALQRHAWPGNVRELENVVERAMIASAAATRFSSTNRWRSAGPAPSRSPVTDNLDAMQRAHIESVLQRCGWRINGTGNAAERLGIHPNTLRFRMKKLGVVCPPNRGRRHETQPSSSGMPA